MDVGIFAEPHRGATDHDQMRWAETAEQLGFSAWLRADHLEAMSDRDRRVPPTDAWTSLALVAGVTRRIRIGTLVSPVGFRHAGMLAVQAAQVARLAGDGRVSVGLGAGWYGVEHYRHGLPFPSAAGARLAELEDQLAMLVRLFRTAGQADDGQEAAMVLVPGQQRPRIIVGGAGERRTPRLAAELADEFNIPFRAPQVIRSRRLTLHDWCEKVERLVPPALSTGVVVACAATQAEADRVAEPLRHATVLPAEAPPVIGTPGRVVDYLGQLAGEGVQHVYLRLADPVFGPAVRDQLEFIAAEVLPQLPGR